MKEFPTEILQRESRERIGRGRMMKIIVVIIVSMLLKGTAAETLTVGDEDGWTFPSSSDFYSSWAAKQTFAVGNTLVFDFKGNHTVVQVTSKDAYDKCDQNLDNNAKVYITSPTKIPLITEGEIFFFCNVNNHCHAGQKFAISVTSTRPSSSPKPSPAEGSEPNLAKGPRDQLPPESPNKDSAPKPMALTLTTFSLLLGAFIIALGCY